MNEKKPTTHLPLVLGLTFGILLPLLVILLAVSAVVAKRKGVFESCSFPGSSSISRGADRYGTTEQISGPTMQLQVVHQTPKSMTILNFEEHMRNFMNNGRNGFVQEFNELKRESPQNSCFAAKVDDNLIKNRWVKILPFDFSRVKILPKNGERRSDFINASFIPGDSYLLQYIATQGPLTNTVDDLWTMVWQQSIPVIVMLTQCVERAVKNCEQYWPSPGEKKLYGDIQVESASEMILNSYIVRRFNVQHRGLIRPLIHMHYTNWPVYGCPRDPVDFLHFMSNVRDQFSDRRPGPTLVHCSAGVGRTGTFITVDRLWHHLDTSDDIDVYGTVLDIRRFRPHMVHTEDQYTFIYSCIQSLLKERNQPEENIYQDIHE